MARRRADRLSNVDSTAFRLARWTLRALHWPPGRAGAQARRLGPHRSHRAGGGRAKSDPADARASHAKPLLQCGTESPSVGTPNSPRASRAGARVRHARNDRFGMAFAGFPSCHEDESPAMKVSSFDAARPFDAAPAVPRHVLVVESDPDQRRRVFTQLSNWGYSPLAAGSAEEALELMGRARFVFSLVAIRLPGLSGIDLIRRAPELAEGGPVIMVADTGHSAEIVEAIQAGADDFIRRPYTADDLQNAIRTVAGRPRREAPMPAADDNGERFQR